MKNQALFSSKDKSKNSKCRLLQLLFGDLRVNLADKSVSSLFLLRYHFNQSHICVHNSLKNTENLC